MPLRYVLDEHLRGPLWRAIRQHNRGSTYPIDVLRVGDAVDLPLGSPDPDILLWAEREGRVIVSLDKGTMLGFLANHLHSGHHSAGVYIVRLHATIPRIVDHLVISAYLADPVLLQDSYEYIP